MNPEIQQHLISYLDKLEVLAKQGADFAADQIPLVLQEYILYRQLSTTVSLIGSLLLLTLALIVLRTGYKALLQDEHCRNPERWVPFLIVGIVGCIFSPIGVASYVDPCIKVWTAPRVVLIEKLNELRK